MERHHQSQRHQRATGLPYSRINALKRLLKLDAARAHRSNRESQARSRHLARQQYYRLTHCTRSERVTIPVGVPTLQRRNRLLLLPIARMRRKCPR